MNFARRTGRLGTESAFAVLARAKELEAAGHDIVHLQIGEPDFPTPPHIVEAGCRALRDGHTHYTPAAGIPELREAIAEEVSRTRDISVSPSQVIVTPGGKPVMFFAILALVEAGDEVVLPGPSFPIYESMIRFAGATPVPVALLQESDFRMDVGMLREAMSERTKLVILNSPANPTGGVMTEEDFSEVAGVLRGYPEVAVLSDEIYSRLVFDGDFHSIASEDGLSTSERTIILDGFSKTYAMTGWRIGYGVMPEELARHVERLQVNSNSCTNAATQHAAIAALTGPQDAVEEMRSAFRDRAKLISDLLNEIPGIECALPKGAFYAFPRVAETGYEADDLADLLLTEAGVACLSGTGFGAYGEGHLRLSCASSEANIERAVERIAAFLTR